MNLNLNVLYPSRMFNRVYKRTCFQNYRNIKIIKLSQLYEQILLYNIKVLQDFTNYGTDCFKEAADRLQDVFSLFYF